MRHTDGESIRPESSAASWEREPVRRYAYRTARAQELPGDLCIEEDQPLDLDRISSWL